MTERRRDTAPETVNNEQQDAETQAQTVAGDAIAKNTSALGLEESAKRSAPLDPSDTPDLVDHIEQMDTSGMIDMSAYSGEESMDDLENRHGHAAAPDPDFAEDDS